MSSPPAPVPAAVVFDFDGLLLDTETPIFEAARTALAGLGHRLTIEGWSSVIGHGDGESFAIMEQVLGASIDRVAYDEAFAAAELSARDAPPPNPGVLVLLDALHGAGVPCAIASSSPAPWIEGHLARLALRDRFSAVASSDRVGGRAKPAPDTYLLACADLGVDPASCVAIEDSAPGVAAARSAGLNVVAVPSAITRHTDLSAAHRTVATLAHLTLADLAQLVAERHA